MNLLTEGSFDTPPRQILHSGGSPRGSEQKIDKSFRQAKGIESSRKGPLGVEQFGSCIEITKFQIETDCLPGSKIMPDAEKIGGDIQSIE